MKNNNSNNTNEVKRIDFNSTENQRIKGDFVGREVYCNVNQMAEYILQKSFEDSDAPFTYEELDLQRFSYTGHYIAFDYLTYTQKEEVQEELQSLVDRLNDFETYEIEEEYFSYLTAGTYKAEQLSKIEEELSEIEDLEGDYIEVYEWWAVSNWLAEKLEEKGEIVAYTGMTCIWGRGTTGQAILLDYVISEICNDLELLK